MLMQIKLVGGFPEKQSSSNVMKIYETNVNYSQDFERFLTLSDYQNSDKTTTSSFIYCHDPSHRESC